MRSPLVHALLTSPLAAYFVNHDEEKITVEDPLFLGLSLLALFLAATLLTLRKVVDEQPLSVLQTDQVKGVAILLVLVSHLYGYVLLVPSGELTRFRDISGSVGVALFLLLSGFGLCVSLRAKGLYHFFSKRIARIYVPILLAMTLEILLTHYLLHPETSLLAAFSKLVLSLPDVDRNLWFITFILFWYCLLYLLFVFGTSDGGKLFVLFGTALLFFVLPRLSSSWKVNAFSFPFGCCLGLYAPTVVAWLKALVRRPLALSLGPVLGLVLLALGVGAFLDRFTGSPVLTAGAGGLALAALAIGLWAAWDKRGSLFEIGSALLAVTSVVLYLKWVLQITWGQEEGLDWWVLVSLECLLYAAAVILLVQVLVKYELYSGFLSFVGGISFELYLLHGMFMYSYDFILFRGNLVVTFFIYLVLICLASVLLQKLSSVVVRLLPRS
jgi:peptidoglycan/LPS O-acetylase OafA/YrhL